MPRFRQFGSFFSPFSSTDFDGLRPRLGVYYPADCLERSIPMGSFREKTDLDDWIFDGEDGGPSQR